MNELRRLPPLKLLPAFEATARTLSFTQAADLLDVQQPAVSRQVRALEAFLGVPLFARNGPSIALTEAGEQYRQEVAAALRHLLLAGDSLPRPFQVSKLTVSVNFGLAAYWLMPRLARFQADHPTLSVNVMTTERDTRLRPDDVDLAIRFGDGSWNDGRTTWLFREQVFPVCTPAYLQSHPPLCKPEDLLAQTLIHLNVRGAPWCNWRQWLGSYGVDAMHRGGLRFNNFTLSLQAALDGHGIALGWAHIVDWHLQQELLVRPLAECLATDLGYYAVMSPDLGGSPLVMELLERLVAAPGHEWGWTGVDSGRV